MNLNRKTESIFLANQTVTRMNGFKNPRELSTYEILGTSSDESSEQLNHWEYDYTKNTKKVF